MSESVLFVVGTEDAGPKITWWTRVVAEWRWLLIVSLVLLVALEMPFRLAASHGASGLHFGGMLWGINDPPQYYSAMRQGATSASWLIVDQFTAEPHQPALLYPLYVGLGKLGSVLGLGLETTFLHASSLGRIFLLAAVFVSTGLISRERRMRRAAFLLVVTSSGIGSLLSVVTVVTGFPIDVAQRDREQPELSTFLTFLTAPHLTFGLGLLLLAARVYAECWIARRPWLLLALALTIVAAGLVNPFSLVPFVVAISVHAVVMTWLLRRIELGGWSATVVAVVAAIPSIAGNAATFMLDPFWSQTYGSQNVQLTPPPHELLEAFGLLLPLFVIGVPSLRRGLTPGRVLTIVWVATALLLMHLPLGTQRRFGAGLHTMLALLAAPGALLAWEAFNRWSRAGRRRLVRPFLITIVGQSLFGTSVLSYVVVLFIALAPGVASLSHFVPEAEQSPYYPGPVLDVAGWLRSNASPDDVVLGADLTGNYLAGATPSRVYVGHWVATLGYGRKLEESNWFFSAPLDEARVAFLRSEGIRYVVYGPKERRLGGASDDSSVLRRVFTTPDIELFEVAPTTAGWQADESPNPAISGGPIELVPSPAIPE